jgi:hypothetical protein
MATRTILSRAGLLMALAILLHPAPAGGSVALDPYQGLGAWIDIYDEPAWRHPEQVIRGLGDRGVGTLFLQTCNYGCPEALYRPVSMARLIRAAHARDIRVVAWYLPGLDNPRRDLRRSLAAIRFRTWEGQGFDSFALDIEARLVEPPWIRNRRLIALSRRIRTAAGEEHPLGAITPPWFYDWPNFPYRALARSYDVFLPMNYFLEAGPVGARVHTVRNIRLIRQATGIHEIPIHSIGGVADNLTPRQTRAVVRAARSQGVMGTSLYDAFTSGGGDWRALRAVGGVQPSSPPVPFSVGPGRPWPFGGPALYP